MAEFGITEGVLKFAINRLPLLLQGLDLLADLHPSAHQLIHGQFRQMGEGILPIRGQCLQQVCQGGVIKRWGHGFSSMAPSSTKRS